MTQREKDRALFRMYVNAKKEMKNVLSIIIIFIFLYFT
jgi:hypothetical protein